MAFRATVTFGGADHVVVVLSPTIVVVVHGVSGPSAAGERWACPWTYPCPSGNQLANACATVLWDNAFAAPERVPFAVPAQMDWGLVGAMLNSYFTSINGRPLDAPHLA